MRYFFRFFVIGSAFFATLSSFDAEAATLHSIVVCDTTADNIGSSVEADYGILKRELRAIAMITEMDFKETSFTGLDVTGNILTAIAEMSFGSDDVVFFYFSGHGYRVASKGNNQWPNLYLTPTRRGIDLLEVVTILQDKQPRLLLAIADCCNNVIPEKYAPILVTRKARALMMKAPSVKHNYQQLFVHCSGRIVISGSIPGQTSWCGNNGGTYTIAFFHSLNQEAYTFSKADWRVVLDRASLNVINEDKDQMPQYELFLKD